jgi:hypothetical protein
MINSIDIIKKVAIENSQIEVLNFYEFKSYELIQDRINLIEEPLKIVFTNALVLRDEYSLPFWDSFNVNLFEKKINDFSFLKEINFHNNFFKKIIIQKDDFIKNEASFINYTGFSSRINSDTSDFHIPLFDFHIPISDENQKICLNILKQLNLKGYLLNSGKSYHFIGNFLMNYEQLQNILFNALLFSPIIDKSWIAHQLLQRYCCLRVSKKYERLPILVEEIT